MPEAVWGAVRVPKYLRLRFRHPRFPHYERYDVYLRYNLLVSP